MNELSLYTGAAGGVLGTSLLNWTPKGYVEIDGYCQKVIAQRIKDGILPEAPIFGDVRAFIDQGYARAYSGMVDVVTGGFPCQPFSEAGSREGASDPRNMWPATIEIIRQVEPRYCFLENVRGLLWSGYFPQILQELAESGYDARWCLLSAAAVGAPHRRERLWIVGSRSDLSNPERDGQVWSREDEHQRQRQEVWRDQLAGGDGRNGDVADTQSEGEWGLPVRPGGSQQTPADTDRLGQEMADTDREGQPEPGAIGGRSQIAIAQPRRHRGSWWSVEPDVGRVAHGVASRVDRLTALGNGQVPEVVKTAWELLTR